jgi:phosphatidylglycerophosphate synthase
MTAEFSQWDRMTWIVAAALIQLRLLANLFDGMVAIEAGKASPIGELYNEIPDRVSDSATLIGLGYATGGLPILGFIAAILAMLTAYVRAVGKVAGASQHFCGPMAKQHRMFLVTVVAIFCGIAPTTWQVVSLGATGVGWPTIVLYVIILGALVTAMRRLFRIASELSKGLG